MASDGLLTYDFGDRVQAFTTMRDAALPFDVLCPHQVHGYKVGVVDRPGMSREDFEGCDALVTNLTVAIGVRTADCIPILLHDPVRKTAAAIHAGWKGTVQKIVLYTVSKMYTAFGSMPGDIRAVIGPGIGVDSFQVGGEVAQMVKDAGFPFELVWRWDVRPVEGSMKGGHHVDLKAANRWLLESAGVLSDNITCCGICTYEDPRFFSARREGYECGRNINAIRLP